MSSFTDRFGAAVTKYNQVCPPSAAEKFEILAGDLLAAGEKMNLTAITDEDGIILRHFIDCMTVLPYIKTSAVSLADVGCGGGFPTLPIAVCRPDIKITAIDSTAKKPTFVDEMAKKLSLNVETKAVRAEEYGKSDGRAAFDTVVSRAVARMNILCELCLPLVNTNGRFIAMKGSDGQNELREAEKAIKTLGGEITEVGKFTLGDAGERRIIVIDKVRETPECYPRPYAKIKSRPL